MILVALAMALSAPQYPPPPPTARDLYVGCYLFVRNTDVPDSEAVGAPPFSGLECAAQALARIADREGPKESGSNRYRFCLPNTVEISADPTRAMAYAYMELLEAHPRYFQVADGTAIYIIAMSKKWPCADLNP